MLAWFKHNGVAHKDCGNNLLDDLTERVVPRGNASDNPDRFTIDR